MGVSRRARRKRCRGGREQFATRRGPFAWLRETRDGDDLAPRRRLLRPDLGRDLLRVLLREVEEPREDVGAILRRDDPRQLDDARQAQAPVAKGLDDSGEPLDELRRRLAVVRRALRQSELAVQEVEERGVPQRSPVVGRSRHSRPGAHGTGPPTPPSQPKPFRPAQPPRPRSTRRPPLIRTVPCGPLTARPACPPKARAAARRPPLGCVTVVRRGLLLEPHVARLEVAGVEPERLVEHVRRLLARARVREGALEVLGEERAELGRRAPSR